MNFVKKRVNVLQVSVMFVPGDTMTVEDSDELDRCSALFTVAAYVVANLEDMLPRDGDYPDDGVYPPPSGATAIFSMYHSMVFLAAVILHKMV